MNKKLVIIPIIIIALILFCCCSSLISVFVGKDVSSSRVYLDQSSNLSNQQIAEQLWKQYLESNKLSLFHLGTIEDYKIESLKANENGLTGKENGYDLGNSVTYSVKPIYIIGNNMFFDSTAGNGVYDESNGWINKMFRFFDVSKGKDLLGREYYYIRAVATGP